MSESIYKKLNDIDVSKYIKEKNKLKYLSWSHAWNILKNNYPQAIKEIKTFDDKPYLHDDNLGYMVFTAITIDGQREEMHLPVLDNVNNALKSTRWSYKVKEWKNGNPTGNYIDKWVESATMFDINNALMRCLVKNMAAFGLAINLYTGEDIPTNIITEDSIQSDFDNIETLEELNIYYSKNKTTIGQNKRLIDMFKLKKIDLEQDGGIV